MRIDIAALFPDICAAVLNTSITGRAIKEGKARLFCHQLRDYTENRHFGNQLIDEFVESVKQACAERSVPVIDIHTVMSGEDGALPEGYCSDGFIHLSNAGRRAVVDALYQWAGDKGA